MGYFLEVIVNLFVMGKPDKKDIKWLPILVITIVLFALFTMFLNRAD